MELSNMIKEGKWFCAIEGIAIADKVYNFYFEEYDSIPQNKKIGDLKMSVVQYRLFCDFEGNPITRNRFKYFNAAYCSPISEKWEKVLKKSICNNPKEYTSFIKSSKKSKGLKGTVILNYVFDERDKDNVICGINIIHKRLPLNFTFLDFKKNAVESHWIINVEKPSDDVFDSQMYIRIFLGYKFGDSFENKILFNELDFEIRGKSSSCK